MNALKELKAMEGMYAIIETFDPADADRIYGWARDAAKKAKAANRFLRPSTIAAFVEHASNRRNDQTADPSRHALDFSEVPYQGT